MAQVLQSLRLRQLLLLGAAAVRRLCVLGCLVMQ
jgi:hypothetical protein